MRIELYLDANETNKDINTLNFTNAILKFIDEHNEHRIIEKPIHPNSIILATDIAEIILLLTNSASALNKELQNG